MGHETPDDTSGELDKVSITDDYNRVARQSTQTAEDLRLAVNSLHWLLDMYATHSDIIIDYFNYLRTTDSPPSESGFAAQLSRAIDTAAQKASQETNIAREAGSTVDRIHQTIIPPPNTL